MESPTFFMPFQSFLRRAFCLIFIFSFIVNPPQRLLAKENIPQATTKQEVIIDYDAIEKDIKRYDSALKKYEEDLGTSLYNSILNKLESKVSINTKGNKDVLIAYDEIEKEILAMNPQLPTRVKPKTIEAIQDKGLSDDEIAEIAAPYAANSAAGIAAIFLARHIALKILERSHTLKRIKEQDLARGRRSTDTKVDPSLKKDLQDKILEAKAADAAYAANERDLKTQKKNARTLYEKAIADAESTEKLSHDYLLLRATLDHISSLEGEYGPDGKKTSLGQLELLDEAIRSYQEKRDKPDFKQSHLMEMIGHRENVAAEIEQAYSLLKKQTGLMAVLLPDAVRNKLNLKSALNLAKEKSAKQEAQIKDKSKTSTVDSVAELATSLTERSAQTKEIVTAAIAGLNENAFDRDGKLRASNEASVVEAQKHLEEHGLLSETELKSLSDTETEILRLESDAFALARARKNAKDVAQGHTPESIHPVDVSVDRTGQVITRVDLARDESSEKKTKDVEVIKSIQRGAKVLVRLKDGREVIVPSAQFHREDIAKEDLESDKNFDKTIDDFKKKRISPERFIELLEEKREAISEFVRTQDAKSYSGNIVAKKDRSDLAKGLRALYQAGYFWPGLGEHDNPTNTKRRLALEKAEKDANVKKVEIEKLQQLQESQETKLENLKADLISRTVTNIGEIRSLEKSITQIKNEISGSKKELTQFEAKRDELASSMKSDQRENTLIRAEVEYNAADAFDKILSNSHEAKTQKDDLKKIADQIKIIEAHRAFLTKAIEAHKKSGSSDTFIYFNNIERKAINLSEAEEELRSCERKIKELNAKAERSNKLLALAKNPSDFVESNRKASIDDIDNQKIWNQEVVNIYRRQVNKDEALSNVLSDLSEQENTLTHRIESNQEEAETLRKRLSKKGFLKPIGSFLGDTRIRNKIASQQKKLATLKNEEERAKQFNSEEIKSSPIALRNHTAHLRGLKSSIQSTEVEIANLEAQLTENKKVSDSARLEELEKGIEKDKLALAKVKESQKKTTSRKAEIEAHYRDQSVEAMASQKTEFKPIVVNLAPENLRTTRTGAEARRTKRTEAEEKALALTDELTLIDEHIKNAKSKELIQLKAEREALTKEIEALNKEKTSDSDPKRELLDINNEITRLSERLQTIDENIKNPTSEDTRKLQAERKEVVDRLKLLAEKDISFSIKDHAYYKAAKEVVLGATIEGVQKKAANARQRMDKALEEIIQLRNSRAKLNNPDLVKAQEELKIASVVYARHVDTLGQLQFMYRNQFMLSKAVVGSTFDNKESDTLKNINDTQKELSAAQSELKKAREHLSEVRQRIEKSKSTPNLFADELKNAQNNLNRWSVEESKLISKMNTLRTHKDKATATDSSGLSTTRDNVVIDARVRSNGDQTREKLLIYDAPFNNVKAPLIAEIEELKNTIKKFKGSKSKKVLGEVADLERVLKHRTETLEILEKGQQVGIASWDQKQIEEARSLETEIQRQQSEISAKAEDIQSRTKKIQLLNDEEEKIKQRLEVLKKEIAIAEKNLPEGHTPEAIEAINNKDVPTQDVFEDISILDIQKNGEDGIKINRYLSLTKEEEARKRRLEEINTERTQLKTDNTQDKNRRTRMETKLVKTVPTTEETHPVVTIKRAIIPDEEVNRSLIEQDSTHVSVKLPTGENVQGVKAGALSNQTPSRSDVTVRPLAINRDEKIVKAARRQRGLATGCAAHLRGQP